MSSRGPAAAIQQPPQHRVAANRSRSAVQVNTALKNARKPGLTVDLTGDGDSKGFGADGSKSLPTAPALGSPSSNKRTRAQAFSNESATVRPSALERQSTTTTVPFPQRPSGQYAAGITAPTKGMHLGASDGTRTERKSHSLDAPLVACRFPQGKCADYCPWTGNHAEDQLFEQTVKSGFQNKPLITNETNTARPSLWNHLKNRQGLSTLSQLFVAVLEKRQAAGRLSAPSTFKPPPRVSLNQTRREAWLSDLANPAVQLRRLSRTIPFGMNGKMLLDACLKKNIPIARAVWLAKCVGANELRAYKRKGAGSSTGISGELKWIREWTTSVEQFVDGTLNLCGEANWTARIHYVIRLSAHLYNEQLLDQEHYLDWILSSFDSSPSEKLPFWLLLVQTYWKHLVATRKRGRRLAEFLFTRLESLSADDSADVLSQVLQRLQQLVTTLAVAHRGCMVLPRLWCRYKNFLQPTTNTQESDALRTAIDDLIERNDRLRPDASDSTNPDSFRTRIFKELDEARFHDSVHQLFGRCAEIAPDLQHLSRLFIQWTTSIYRDGIHRIYICARLLRKCYKERVNVDDVLLSFVTDPPSPHSVDFLLVFKLVAELVRYKLFSVARLFQNLIATGTFSAIPPESELFSTSSAPPLLLSRNQPYERLALLAASIPTQDLPPQVGALRALLLRDAGPVVTTEPQIIAETIRVLQRQMSNPEEATEFPFIPSRLSLPVKFAISHWVKENVLASRSTIGIVHFIAIRQILELVEDHSSLADVVHSAIPHGDPDTLASVADTLHLHYRSFAAIDALKPLYGSLLDRYRYFRGQEQLDKQFVSAVRDLSVTLGLNMPIIQQLNADLARCNQRDAIAMCSPASDNAVDILQIGVDTDDEIERVLTSGTTMDEQIMSRVFKRITARADKSDPEQRFRVGSWFSRLRSFDFITFDRLMAEWMTNLLSHFRPLGLQVLPTMVGAGCITLAAFAQCAERSRVDKDRVFCCELDLDVLEAIFSEYSAPKIASIPDAYRYRLETRKYATQSCKDITTRLQRVVAGATAASNDATSRRLLLFLNNAHFIRFLKWQALDKEQPLSDCLGLISGAKPGNDPQFAGRILNALIDPQSKLGLSEVSRNEQIPQLLKIADELSLPFCQLQMRLLLSTPGPCNGSQQETASKLFEAIGTAADGCTNVWPELVKDLDSRITQKVCEKAETLVLSAVSQLKQPGEPKIAFSTIRKLLSIIDHTCIEPTVQSFQQIAQVLTDRLKLILEALAQLNSIEPTGVQPSGPIHMTSGLQRSCSWIDALIHLAILHKPSSPSQSKPLNELVPFISTLVLLLTHPKLQSSPKTLEYIFDVAAYFSDDLSDEQRNHLSKVEFAKSTEPRISFLFGSSQSPDAWLGLVTRAPTPPPTNSTPSSSAHAPAPALQRPGLPQMSRQGSMHYPIRPGTPIQQQRISQPPQPAKTFNPPVPYPLKRWEILPDQGGSTHVHAQQASGPANDTSISLTLFGARKVG